MAMGGKRARRRLSSAPVLLSFLLLMIPGAGLRSAPREDGARVFPPPPERARLAHLADLQGETGFTEPRSLWRKIADVVVGGAPPAVLSRPLGTDVAGGILVVCDPGAERVHGFRESDSTYFRLPRRGSLPSPIDVALGPHGLIYVSDSRLDEVHCYDERGSLLFRCQGELERPTGLAYHRALDRLFVAETHRHRILVFDAEGRRMGAFGERGEGDGELNFPTALAIDPQGRILVVDALNFRIQIFTSGGEFVRAIGKPGDGPGAFARPKGVAADSDGNIYVVDALLDALQIFDPEGRLLLFIGGSGREPGKFWLPGAVTTDERDRIFVSDTYNGRVQIFQILRGEGASSWRD